MAVRERVIFNGDAGTVWKNDTGKVRYQFTAALINTCGACLQYHLAIGPWWPIPLHRNCRCRQYPIAPGADAPKPFVDFRELLDGMPHADQVAAVGASNYKLISSGVVSWSEVVTKFRVRTLREVIALNKVSLETAAKTGVKVKAPWVAQAFADVHAPEAELIRQHRAELLDKLKTAGLSQDAVVHEISRGIVSKAGIVGGGRAQSMAPFVAKIPHSAELVAVLASFKPKKRRKPPERPQAPPSQVPAPSSTSVEPTTSPTAHRTKRTTSAVPGMPGLKPGEAFMPDRPIALRLASWTEGDQIVQELTNLVKPVAADVQAAYKKAVDYVGSLAPEDHKKPDVKKYIRELRKDAKDVESRWRDFSEHVRDKLKQLLKPAEPATFTTTKQMAGAGTIADEMVGRIDQAQEFVTSVLQKPKTGTDVAVGFTVHKGGEYRANALGSEVHLQSADQARTVAHELGHVLETKIPFATLREKQFLEHRKGDGKARKLNELFPTHGYDDDELGFDDEFGKHFSAAKSNGQFNDASAWYVGKQYSNQSEILSMGIEAMYMDAKAFAANDPEFFKFVAGMLNGRMR